MAWEKALAYYFVEQIDQASRFGFCRKLWVSSKTEYYDSRRKTISCFAITADTIEWDVELLVQERNKGGNDLRQPIWCAVDHLPLHFISLLGRTTCKVKILSDFSRAYDVSFCEVTRLFCNEVMQVHKPLPYRAFANKISNFG